MLAGNVLAIVAAGSEKRVFTSVARHLRPAGFVAVGLGLDRGYPPADSDADAARAGLWLEHRFATWDLRRFGPGSGFGVSIYRAPAD